MHRLTLKTAIVCLVAVAFLGVGAPEARAFPRPAAVIALQQPRPPAAQDEYVPVTQLPAAQQEHLPAAPLLIAAYAFVWLMVLLYVFTIWRRLGKVEREIASVSRQIESTRRE